MKTTRLLLAAAAALLLGLGASAQSKNTFCNPLDLVVGQERAYRGGEPVVLIFQDDYYLFVSHRKGYWYSKDFKDWTYVDAPDYPGGVVSVVEMDGTLYGCSMNNKNVYKCLDPKKGKWEKVGTFDSDRYGDANMFYDNGHLYLYYGWSQIMPFKVVELDKKTFKEISEPKVLFFGDHRKHGFESRRADDVIFSIFNGRRDYYEEEYPWIEGPWMTKHNGKYYLQYAAIGLEFLSYSHGVYVGDSPTGPFTYSPHNPLSFKTTGFAVGAGHGSTFHDKNGQLWTICMIPGNYGGGGRSSELAIYPTAVDKDGVMHSNTALGDWPQYWPGTRTDAVDHNWTGWTLLSHKKKVEVSSTFENYLPSKGVDEDFMTCWAAETGDPGEFFSVDLGKVADVRAIQVNFDHIGAVMPQRGGGPGFGAPQANPEHYQCYKVELSTDKVHWTTVVDKPDNKLDLRHPYFELPKPVAARYVKVTNVATYDDAKFCIKDLRVFGNPGMSHSVVVKDVKAVRNPEDRRQVRLLWEPVPGADGYVVRYGLSPDKLYNSYVVYDDNFIDIHSLNVEPEYCYQVESFDSGLDYYREKTEAVNGMGAEIEINKRGNGNFGYGGNNLSKRVMLKEGVDEYVFEGIDPGYWVINHTYGPVLWAGDLTEKDLVGTGEPGIEAKLTELGHGTTVTGELRMKVVRGPETGKVVISVIRY